MQASTTAAVRAVREAEAALDRAQRHLGGSDPARDALHSARRSAAAARQQLEARR